MSDVTNQHKFLHDCDTCELLTTIEVPDTFTDGAPRTTYDLWFCKRCDGGSVIARRSSEPSDYASSPIELLNVNSHPALLLARSMVKMRKFFKEPT